MVSLLVVVAIGLSLTPVVQAFVDDYIDGDTHWENDDNHDEGLSTSDDITGAKATLAGLVPLFYIIGIVLAAITMAVGEWKK